MQNAGVGVPRYLQNVHPGTMSILGKNALVLEDEDKKLSKYKLGFCSGKMALMEGAVIQLTVSPKFRKGLLNITVIRTKDDHRFSLKVNGTVTVHALRVALEAEGVVWKHRLFFSGYNYGNWHLKANETLQQCKVFDGAIL